tara:strand:+ start:5134 stop:5403 length:270 start_codon:yes stop_codon:yes gene_type:complete
MKDFRGKIVCWNRKTTPPYYGVIVESELRQCGAPLPPWRWYKIKWTSPTPPEFTQEWHRCDHVNIVDAYNIISKLHQAMIVAEEVKGVR